MAKFFIPVLAPTDEKRLTLAKSLIALGHEVGGGRFYGTNKGIADAVRAGNFDAVLLFGNSAVNMFTCYDGMPFILDVDVPYISLWDDSPLRYLHYIEGMRHARHKALFVIDTAVVEQLQVLGFSQAAYMPLFYTDPAVLKPVAVDGPFMPVSFAGNVQAASAVRRARLSGAAFPLSFLHQAVAERFVARRRAARDYVDVFTHLEAEGVNPWSYEWAYLANFLMSEQRAIEREELFAALDDVTVHHFGDWRDAEVPAHVVCHGAVKTAGLSGVYCGTEVNVSRCSQWPRACHERLFQTAASRAFLLHERKADVEALFEPGREVVMYGSLEELADLVRFYRERPKEREAIAAAAHRRFMSDHRPEVFARRVVDAL